MFGYSHSYSKKKIVYISLNNNLKKHVNIFLDISKYDTEFE